MSDTPRYYRWYPTVSCDLGTMPFEGDWTENDRISQTVDWSGVANIYYYNLNSGEFGRNVTKKVNGRLRTVFEPGVPVAPITIVNPNDPEDVRQCPVWFMYYGDGVCTVKIPEGELEPVEV